MVGKLYCSVILFHIIYSTNSHAFSTADALNALCKRYTRNITMLEIGGYSGAYVLRLAKHYHGAYILMDRHLSYQDEVLEKAPFKNIVLLHPRIIDRSLLENLGKCEHFDIVVIRDMEHWVYSDVASSLQAALTLGDHLFVELPDSHVETARQMVPSCEMREIETGKMLCYFAVHKQAITKPRWTANEEQFNNYKIISNFTEKRMDKQSTGTTSSWVPGVNLLTFLILKGVYPTDKMMRKQLKNFKHIDHNDLVLGNIVVQGKHIIPIDFHDKRRNVDPSVCVKAALKKVIREGRLKRDPEEMLHRYSEYLQHHKRRMRS